MTARSSYPLKLPTSIKDAAAQLAKEDGVSLNQWIAAAVAEKVGTIRTTSEFLKLRAAGANAEGLREFLLGAPDASPETHDELPD